MRDQGAALRESHGRNWIISTLTLALLLSLAGCREPEQGSASHPPETVQRSYELHCLGCHGAKGEGAWGSDIRKLPTSVEAIAAVIANGAEKMPAFKGHLTPEQMREMAEYVKTFK